MKEIKKFVNNQPEFLETIFDCGGYAKHGGNLEYRLGNMRPIYHNRFVGFISGLLFDVFCNWETEDGVLNFMLRDNVQEEVYHAHVVSMIVNRVNIACSSYRINFNSYEVNKIGNEFVLTFRFA